MRIKKNLKWALVLGGGGSRGIAHVGVLNALEEMGLPEPSLVVGTSMGAIIGGIYACGMSPGAMKQFFLDGFDIAHYLDSFAFKISGALGKVFQTGQILGNAITRTGIDSGQLVFNLMEKLSGGKTFAETRIPFRCNAVDLAGGREVVFRSGSVARAIRASMSFPGVFEPLMDGGLCLADGGLVDNLPVRIARKEGFRRILAVNVQSFLPVSPLELQTFPKILYRSMKLLLNVGDKKFRPPATLTIHASDGTAPFDFSPTRELIELGERAVRENKDAALPFFCGGIGASAERKRHRECGFSD
ncbi:MAG: patatin-like phospholipase family protein [Treponema sp.]|jgi:NTE family protein|nr:patatin-like phospholipase family protein [Treponema sp.]